MVHAKSNRLSDEQLLERARAESRDRFRFRHEMFLRLYRTIRLQWEAELAKHDSIDFEDMLNLAADHVEAGRCNSPFRLVMVDEMQDASAARARLARALVAEPGHYLFAVGDDWQSINRFAGADLSVMTNFEDWFGPGEILRLERTFRCPQPICDLSSRFVMKNPAQLPKSVVSSTAEHPPSFVAIAAASDEQVAGVIRKHLAELNDRIASGTRAGGARREGIRVHPRPVSASGEPGAARGDEEVGASGGAVLHDPCVEGVGGGLRGDPGADPGQERVPQQGGR